MAVGKKDGVSAKGPLDGLEEATCGFDPYLSDLINEGEAQIREERRRTPRDTTPARRRSLLVTGEDQDSEAGQG